MNSFSTALTVVTTQLGQAVAQSPLNTTMSMIDTHSNFRDQLVKECDIRMTTMV